MSQLTLVEWRQELDGHLSRLTFGENVYDFRDVVGLRELYREYRNNTWTEGMAIDILRRAGYGEHIDLDHLLTQAWTRYA